MTDRPKHSSLLRLKTTWGILHVGAQDGCIVFCHLPQLGDRSPRKEFRFLDTQVEAATTGDAAVLKKAERYIVQTMKGERATMPKLGKPQVSVFTGKVLRALQAIPRGETVSYGAVAKRIRSPKSSRAVGRACGANPLPIFIPCHRVLAANGGLGGFSCGTAWKELLLSREMGA